MTERRGTFPIAQLLMIWAALSALLLAATAGNILGGLYPDPDDTLRLVQVRDLLSGQAWYDLTQYRIDPPNGTHMHWSRLVDLPLATVIFVLTPLLGQPVAEIVASALVPLFLLGIIIALVGRLAWRLLGREAAIFACLAAGLMPALVFQIQPMRIDHHGWQIAMVATALFAISGRKMWIGGVSAGLTLTADSIISIEILPIAGAFGFVLFLRWLRDRNERMWLVAYLQAFAGGLCLLFLLLRGWGDLAAWCDVISPAHIGFFCVAALGTGLVSAMPNVPRWVLLFLFACIGIAGIAVFGMTAPSCLGSPFGNLDPVVREYWYTNVLEGRPIWEQKLSEALPVAVQLLAALGAAIVLHLRGNGWLRQWWFDFAVLLALTILAGVITWRSMAFASLIGLIPLGWLVTVLLGRMREAVQALHKLGAALIIVAILLPSGVFSAVSALLPASAADAAQSSAESVSASSCDIASNAGRLDALNRGTIFAPLDIGPSILLRSQQSVVATGHHRSHAAMSDVISAFIAPEAQAREIIAAHTVQYIAICTDLAEVKIYADAHSDGLAAMLIAGEPPDWLEAIDLGGPEEFSVWRLVR